MSEELKECLLCRRIDYNQMALYAFQLWPDNEARKNTELAGTLIRDTYTNNPPLLCGRSPKAITGAALYIAQFMNGTPSKYVTQGVIGKIVNITEPSIQNLYKIIVKANDIDFSILREKFHCTISKIKQNIPRVKCRECANLIKILGTRGRNNYKNCKKNGYKITIIGYARICEDFSPINSTSDGEDQKDPPP